MCDRIWRPCLATRRFTRFASCGRPQRWFCFSFADSVGVPEINFLARVRQPYYLLQNIQILLEFYHEVLNNSWVCVALGLVGLNITAEFVLPFVKQLFEIFHALRNLCRKTSLHGHCVRIAEFIHCLLNLMIWIINLLYLKCVDYKLIRTMN